jgi:hypothetical protein
VQDIYPLAPLQEGILFHHLMETEGDVYLLSAMLRFDTRERVEGFVKALGKVIERHDILRTAVVWEGLREPAQVVWRRASLSVEEIEVEGSGAEAEEELWSRFDARRRRIDLRRAPMMRLYIAHDRKSERWLMLYLFHHLTADHTTLEAMLKEIKAHMKEEGDRLPEPLPFRNFVAQARWGLSREEHEEFFRGMLGDVNEPTAPYGLVNVHGDGREIREARREVEERLCGRLIRTARKLGVSAASLYHLAWAQVLARVSGRANVVFGTVLFGRMEGGEGVDRAPGMFINTLPVRIRVGERGVEESVLETHRTLTELLRHEHAALAVAQRCSGVEAPAPLFSALMNYRHGREEKGDGVWEWEGIEALRGGERTNYPISLNVDDLSC